MSILPLEETDLECGVCFSVFFDPITISCGHTFCRECLHQTVLVKRTCPFCRAPTHVDVSSAPTNALISKLVEKCFPDLVSRRKEDTMLHRRIVKTSHPLFVSMSVSFPNHMLSLHIFESRYRFMVNQCVNTDRKFVVTTPIDRYLSSNHNHQGSANIEYGCVATIRDCVHLPDGRSMVTAELGDRVVLENVHQIENSHGLLTAEILPFEEDFPIFPMDASIDEQKQITQRLGELKLICLEKAETYLRVRGNSVEKYLSGTRGTLPLNDLSKLSLWFAGLVQPERGIETRRLKVECFMSRNVVERFELSVLLLDDAIDREKRIRNFRSFVLLAIIISILVYGAVF